MELVYGNDGTNYRTLAKTSDISSAVESKIVSDFVKYTFVKDRSAFSSAACEPEAICYSTTDLNGALTSERVVLVKTGRMTRYSTPCFYAHAHIVDAEDEFYKTRFFDVFDYHFISDTEASEITSAGLSHYQSEALTVSSNALTQDQVKMILTEFFYNERLGRVIRIIVDRSGDEYNLRTREILKEIYSYLPYYFRKRYGFITYADEVQTIPAKIGFVLFNRDQVLHPEDMNIDLLSDSYEKIKSRVKMPDLIAYVEKLVGMSDAQRKEHFETLEEITVGGRLSVKDCINYSTYRENWKKKDIDELMPEWIDYVYRQGYQKGAMFQRLTEIIASRIDNEYYNEYLFERLEREDLFSLSEETRKTILFADDVPGLAIDRDRMTDWYYARWSASGSDEERAANIDTYISNLKSLDIGSAQLKEICAELVEYLEIDKKSYLDEEKKKKDEALGRDRALIDEKFSRATNARELVENSRELLEEVTCPESKELVRNTLKRRLEPDVKQNAVVQGMPDYFTMYIDKVLRQAAGMIDDDILSSWIEKIEAHRQDIIENDKELHNPEVRLDRRTDLIALICKYSEVKDKIDRISDTAVECAFSVHIDKGRDEELKVDMNRMEGFISFLLKPDERNYRTFREILSDSRNKSMEYKILALLENDLFTAEHFEYLIDMQNRLRDWNTKEKLKDYITKYAEKYFRDYPGYYTKDDFALDFGSSYEDRSREREKNAERETYSGSRQERSAGRTTERTSGTSAASSSRYTSAGTSSSARGSARPSTQSRDDAAADRRSSRRDVSSKPQRGIEEEKEPGKKGLWPFRGKN